MNEQEQQMLDTVRQALVKNGTRLSLDRDWSGRPCMRLSEQGQTKGGNPKWTPVGPVLFGDPDDNTHASALRHLAGMIEQAS